MLVNSHQCNGILNHNEIPLHTYHDSYTKKQIIASVRMWIHWNTQTLLVEMQNGIAALGNSLAIFQKDKHKRFNSDPSILVLVIY